VRANSKLEDRETVRSVISLVEATSIPVSVDFVAFNLKLNWATTRALLLQLSLQGELRALKTSKSWVFMKR
jgi:hypothetical protein